MRPAIWVSVAFALLLFGCAIDVDAAGACCGGCFNNTSPTDFFMIYSTCYSADNASECSSGASYDAANASCLAEQTPPYTDVGLIMYFYDGGVCLGGGVCSACCGVYYATQNGNVFDADGDEDCAAGANLWTNKVARFGGLLEVQIEHVESCPGPDATAKCCGYCLDDSMEQHEPFCFDSQSLFTNPNVFFGDSVEALCDPIGFGPYTFNATQFCELVDPTYTAYVELILADVCDDAVCNNVTAVCAGEKCNSYPLNVTSGSCNSTTCPSTTGISTGSSVVSTGSSVVTTTTTTTGTATTTTGTASVSTGAGVDAAVAGISATVALIAALIIITVIIWFAVKSSNPRYQPV